MDIARDDPLVKPDDELRRGGYPDGYARYVVVVRDGKAVLILTYEPDGYGGWLRTGESGCSGGSGGGR